MFLFPFNDAFALVKGWDYTSEEHTARPLPLGLARTFTLSAPISLQRGPVCLIIDLVHRLTRCMADSNLAWSQTTDRVQKSLQIILSLLLWPTVQNIHLHWASLKSALTASKHWTPSTATTVSIFKQHPPRSILPRTFPHSRARGVVADGH